MHLGKKMREWSVGELYVEAWKVDATSLESLILYLALARIFPIPYEDRFASTSGTHV